MVTVTLEIMYYVTALQYLPKLPAFFGLSSLWDNRYKLTAIETSFRKDLGSMGSSAAREMLLRRMKSRMKLVKGVALMIRWHILRNLSRNREVIRADAGTPCQRA